MPQKLTPDVISILEHIPNAFYALDKEFRFVHVNRKVLDLLGWKESELLGNNIWDVFPEYKQLPFYDVLHEAMSGKTTAHLERFSKPLNRWFEMYAYPSDYGLAIYLHDITERKQAEIRLRMLNESAKILAYEHDLSQALERIAGVIIPEFADWLTINELQGDEVKTLAYGTSNQESAQWVSDYLQRVKLDLDKPRPDSAGWVIKIGRPVVANIITDEYLRGIAGNEDHYEVLKRGGLKSRLVVPMSLRGKTTGAITFLSSTAGRIYEEADLRFATDLSILIGLSIENMRMYNEMRKDLAQKIRNKSISMQSQTD